MVAGRPIIISIVGREDRRVGHKRTSTHGEPAAAGDITNPKEKP